MKVNILGQDYEILHQTEKENPKLADCYGVCETYAKEIILCINEPNPNNLNKFDLYEKKVLRHEIVHAFFHESGLDANSKYARDEELVDWLAIQIPKIIKAMKDTECL